MKDNSIPTVSVIIPLYNREKLVRRAIESILMQSYSDFELIVVDDCSTDNSAEVVQNINDERIVYIKHDVNKGANVARNTGIKMAKGKYIAFQDSDDEWLQGKLERQMNLMNVSSANTGIVYCGFWRFEENSKRYIPLKWVVHLEGYITDELLKGSFVSTQTILVKKECFKNLGLFDEKLPRLQDWELVIRLSQKYEFKYIEEGLVNVYHTVDSITSNSEKLRIAYNLIINKYYDLFYKNKRTLAKHYSSIGFSFYYDNDFENAKVYFRKCVKTYPYDVKFLILYSSSLLGKNKFSVVENLFHKWRK